MNDQDIQQFIIAYDDFMKHSENDTEESWEEARQYTEQFLEQKASELEVTVDYYMAEFM